MSYLSIFSIVSLNIGYDLTIKISMLSSYYEFNVNLRLKHLPEYKYLYEVNDIVSK